MYRHQLAAGIDCPREPGKIVCVGRNYAEHARELNNPVESEPLLFLKPATAAVAMAGEFGIPRGRGAVHHELEMAVLIGSTLQDATPSQAQTAIAGIGLAYDLTLRDIQAGLKRKGHPWERAKAFDGACPLSQFVNPDGVDLQGLALELTRNGRLQQAGNTAAMLFSPVDLLVEASRVFTLLPGDVLLTGTPAGVGPLQVGDQLAARLGGLVTVTSKVV